MNHSRPEEDSAEAAVSAILLFGIFMSIQLAPDIEAGLRAEAAARGMDVDALIATAVKAYLRETPSPSVASHSPEYLLALAQLR